jgi:hypothetical protein
MKKGNVIMQGFILRQDELKRNIKTIERAKFLKAPVASLLERVEFEIERLNYENAENKVMLTLLTPLRNELHKMDKKKENDKDNSSKEAISKRLKILEKEVRRAIRMLKKAPMTKRFKFIKKILKELIAAVKKNPEQTEIERIVKLEEAMAETLSVLQNSRLGARSKVLQEIMRNFERVQTASSHI